MRDDEVRLVHINECVRDSELEAADRLCAEADGGEWRVRGGVVVRYSGAPFERPGSLALMAASVRLVPRLVRGIRRLEESLRSAWDSAVSSRRELARERERHEADLLRGRAGQSGPDHEIDVLAEAVELGCIRPALLRTALRLWAAGRATQETPTLRVDLGYARARRAAEAQVDEEVRQAILREHAEVRALAEELRLTKRERAEVTDRARRKAGDSPAPAATAPEPPRGRVRRRPAA